MYIGKSASHATRVAALSRLVFLSGSVEVHALAAESVGLLLL